MAINAVNRPSFISGMQMVAVIPMAWKVAASSAASSLRLSLITRAWPLRRRLSARRPKSCNWYWPTSRGEPAATASPQMVKPSSSGSITA
ncbi:hypothetical protein D3C76_1596960 [compost metagenome]